MKGAKRDKHDSVALGRAQSVTNTTVTNTTVLLMNMKGYVHRRGMEGGHPPEGGRGL